MDTMTPSGADTIARSHALDDALLDLGRARRVARAQHRLLLDAMSALDAGDLDVVREFLDRSTTALSSI